MKKEEGIEISLTLTEIKSMFEVITSTLENLKEDMVEKIYDTKELCKYLNVDKSVIDNYRRTGELNYSKLGRKVVYRQSDIDKLLEKTSVNYVGL